MNYRDCLNGVMVYEEVEIEDMTYEVNTDCYTYQCPCGDLFRISREDMKNGEEYAYCASCPLYIRVIYD